MEMYVRGSDAVTFVIDGGATNIERYFCYASCVVAALNMYLLAKRMEW